MRPRRTSSCNENGSGIRVDVVRSAVGAARATAHLSAPDLEALAAQASLHADPSGNGCQSVEVPVVALDDAVTEPIDLLKIDVEGHEMAVLDGATELFRLRPPQHLVRERVCLVRSRPTSSKP